MHYNGDIKGDLIPTVISDDGKRRVIRYSLKNGSNPPQKTESNIQKRTIEFVDHQGFQPVERGVRVGAPQMGERSRSNYIRTEPSENIVRKVISNSNTKIQREPKVISVKKSTYLNQNPPPQIITLNAKQNNTSLPKFSRINHEPSQVEEVDMSMYHSKMDVNRFNSKVKNMESDLNQTVASEIDKNNKLVHTVNQLKKALDMEKKRTMELDQRLRDEFKEYKRTENEKIEIHEKCNQKLNEIKSEIGNNIN